MVALPFMKAIRRTVSEFSENTSIHGVRYITENGRGWIDRIVWIITEAVCVVSAVYMLMSVLLRFNENPTMTRVESYFYNVANVPFPGITLCNVNNIFRSRALRIVDRLKVPAGFSMSKGEIMELLHLVAQLLSLQESGADLTGRNRLQRLLVHNNMSALEVLEELGQPCKEMLERCSWEGREVSCDSIFKTTMTYLGFCCSFNEFASYGVLAARKAPLTTAFYGYPMGLTVLLNVETYDYFWGSLVSGGVVCSVHDSNELASERSPQAMVSVNREVMVQVVPSIRNGTTALRAVSPERRRCLFDDEYHLRSSATYSYDSCLVDCKAGLIWKACGCRPVYFPPIFGKKAKPCGLDKIACLMKFYEEERTTMAMAQVHGELPSDPAFAEALSENKFQACGCLAQCNSVSYDIETTTADFGASQWVQRGFYKNVNSTDRTLLHVFYDSETTALFINDLVSDTVQLMSSLGGIFSLFLGCSFMSAVELLYFFTVRLWLLFRGEEPTIPVTNSPPHYNSPADNPVSKSFSHQALQDNWGWGSDKPTRPRAF